MQFQAFYDQTLALIEAERIETALPMLVGQLFNARTTGTHWDKVKADLHDHPLYPVLLQDPANDRCVRKPRGYAGDAALIDFYYDRRPPEDTSPLGRLQFSVTNEFQSAQGVRMRRDHAQGVIERAWSEGKRICSLACGHLREADDLVGNDLSNVVAVDQDRLSLEEVRRKHGASLTIVQANVFSYLQRAARSGTQFDLIYTLGLTDYLDERAMQLLHRLAHSCLAPGGRFMLANFVPQHLAVGWLDAIMDWHLIYRDEIDLAKFAFEAGLVPKTWRDPSGCIAWCEMEKR